MPNAGPEGPTAEERRRARTILGRLEKRYPSTGTALEYRDPWQLLVSTVLTLLILPAVYSLVDRGR